jgi:hypothetical protein
VSRFAFEIPTAAEAREFLEWRAKNKMFQSDLYQDTIACQRVIAPFPAPAERDVTSPAERDVTCLQNGSAQFPTFACMDCGKFAFSKPTLCYWCGSSVPVSFDAGATEPRAADRL